MGQESRSAAAAHSLMSPYRCLNYLLNGGDIFSPRENLGHSMLEIARQYVNYASVHDMTQNHVSSPMDRMGVKGLKIYKVDKALKEW